MPSLRKLSAAEIAVLEQPTFGLRAQVAREYDAYLADFAAGDHGRVELALGEQRAVVRARLHAAARRRGFALHFRPGPSAALIFYVVAAPTMVAPAPAPAADQRRDEAARREPTPRRSPRQRGSSAERYHEVLPRWMREGGQGGRRGDSKRRHGR